MMKPGIGSYDRFKQLFEQYSAEAGKKQFLIPYFIAAHPGTTDEDMIHLAVWLKKNGFRADQVQAFYPSAHGHRHGDVPHGPEPAQGRAPRRPRREPSTPCKGERRRRLHKAFLRWHDPGNWPLLRQALKDMGRADLIGNGKQHLIPTWQPATDGGYQSARRKNSTPEGAKTTTGPAKAAARAITPQPKGTPAKAPPKGRLLTQHTGLPPRATGGSRPGSPVGGGKRGGR
jgi:hypothetical protein